MTLLRTTFLAFGLLCACSLPKQLAEPAPLPHSGNPFGGKVLRDGHQGPEVAALQRALNEQLEPSPNLSITGGFDPATRAAVMRFQEQAGLSADGFVGPQTMKALGADVDPYFFGVADAVQLRGPQSITRNVIQDRQGRLWLASWQGLIRKEGERFVNLTNQEGLRRYRVFSLLEDRSGTVWAGTVGAGAYRIDGEEFVNVTSGDGLASDVVLSIFEDAEGNLWFGGHGVSQFDGHRFSAFTEKDGFTSEDVHSIDQSPDGSLWLGTRGALFRYADGAFVNFTEKHAVPLDENSYTPVLVDRRGHVWFNGATGLYHYDGERVRHAFPLASFVLFEDSQGRIWFSGGGPQGDERVPGISVLHRFDPADGVENLRAASQRIPIEAHQIFGLMEDSEQSIWFGMGRGLGRITGDSVEFF